ncbi:MAG TPA: hypothetical protein VHB21_28160, partial [Minicystis sp.]|nr:hypothetical protein [Minicystis sp.]
VLVRCAYCDADNILGVDLRRDAERAGREATSLADALKKRQVERALWSALAVVAVALLVGSGVLLGEGLAPMAASTGGVHHPAARSFGPPPGHAKPRARRRR